MNSLPKQLITADAGWLLAPQNSEPQLRSNIYNIRHFQFSLFLHTYCLEPVTNKSTNNYSDPEISMVTWY